MYKLKSFIYKKISKLITYFLDLDFIERESVKRKVDRQIKQINIETSSKLTGNAIVYNLQNNNDLINIKRNSVIEGELFVFAYGGKISIGDNCYIGKDSRIWSGDSIHIGNNVLISHNVNIIDTNSHEIDYLIRAEKYLSLLKNGHSKVKETIITAPITIEDHVWINFNTIILKGVKIGRGSIVAAGSVITKDIPEFSLVAGNPAKVVKKIPH